MLWLTPYSLYVDDIFGLDLLILLVVFNLFLVLHDIDPRNQTNVLDLSHDFHDGIRKQSHWNYNRIPRRGDVMMIKAINFNFNWIRDVMVLTHHLEKFLRFTRSCFYDFVHFFYDWREAFDLILHWLSIY